MKTTKLMGLAMTGLVLAGMGGQGVSAAVVENSDGTNATDKTTVANGVNNTTTTVEIIDNLDPTDPLDPTSPTQEMLTLEKVPSLYGFKSKLVNNGQYEITSGTIEGDPITVYNDRVDRAWSVKAVVKDNQLAKKGTTDTFAVSSFSITTGTEDKAVDIVTGSDGIVSKAVDEASRTGANNTGLLKTTVSSIGIKFTDPEGKLKVKDTIEGTIQYTLYNTIDAK